MLVGVGQQSFAAAQVPFAPWSDDLDVWFERVGTELETNLVVAFAGGTMADGIGAGFTSNLDQPFRNQWPGDRRAQQVHAFVNSVRTEHGIDEVAHKLFTQIVDVDLFHTHGFGLGPRWFKFLALAEVGGEGHDLAAVLNLQPFQDDRGVETAGVGQHDLVDIGFVYVRHSSMRLSSEGLLMGLVMGR